MQNETDVSISIVSILSRTNALTCWIKKQISTDPYNCTNVWTRLTCR